MRSAEADAELAKNDFDRARDLAERKVISAAELDAAQSKYTQKKATVDNMQSAIDKKRSTPPSTGPRESARSIPGRWSRWVINWFRCRRSVTSLSIFPCRKRTWENVKTDLPVKVTTDAFPAASSRES